MRNVCCHSSSSGVSSSATDGSRTAGRACVSLRPRRGDARGGVMAPVAGRWVSKPGHVPGAGSGGKALRAAALALASRRIAPGGVGRAVLRCTSQVCRARGDLAASRLGSAGGSGLARLGLASPREEAGRGWKGAEGGGG